MLGHANLSTTERYYADNIGIPAQLLPHFTRWKATEAAETAATAPLPQPLTKTL